jgi:hypothetical protein
MVQRPITSGVVTTPFGTVLTGVKVTFLLVDALTKKAADAWDVTSRERLSGSVTVATNSRGRLLDEQDQPILALWPNDRGTPSTMYRVNVDYPGMRPFYAAVPGGDGALDWLDLYGMGKVLEAASLPVLHSHGNLAVLEQLTQQMIDFLAAFAPHATVSDGQPLWDGVSWMGGGSSTVNSPITADATDGNNYRIITHNGVLAEPVLVASGAGDPVEIIAQDTSNGLSYHITTFNGAIGTIELAEPTASQDNIVYDDSNGKTYRIITIDGAINTEEI